MKRKEFGFFMNLFVSYAVGGAAGVFYSLAMEQSSTFYLFMAIITTVAGIFNIAYGRANFFLKMRETKKTKPFKHMTQK